MTDYDSIWRTQNEIRTVVNAVLGECIWNLSYSERRMVALARTASFIMIRMSAEVSLIPPWLMRTGFISLYA